MLRQSDPTGEPPANLWRNYNFLLLWCAYGISAMGDHISEMAILKTQGALDSSVDITPLAARMMFVFFLPFFLFGPITGLLADSLPRRGLMIFADLVRCVLLFSFGYLIAITDGWGTWGPFFPLFFVGMFAAVFSPARQALLPTIVRENQLVRANGLISGLGIIATMLSAQISGWLADEYPAEISFRVNGVTFIVSALFLIFLRAPKTHLQEAMATDSPPGQGVVAARRSKPIADLVAGFHYARSHRHVLELLAVAALIWFSGPVVISVIPAIVRDVYEGTYSQISIFRVYLGVGFIIGAVVITTLGNALRSEVVLTWGMIGIGLSIGLLAASVFLPSDPATLSRIGMVAMILAGFFGVSVMASFHALMQRTVANRFRGRIFGLKDLVSTMSLLIATGALGLPEHVRVDRWVGWLLIGVSILMLTAGFITLRVRLRRYGEPFLLHGLRFLNEFVCKLWWGLERVGRPTVPREGAVVVTANHRSIPDPTLIHACVSYRVISFLIAAEYTRLPLVGSAIRAIRCIPVRRNTRETGATKQALRYLEDGHAVGIFIEGGIVPPGEFRRPKDGVALLALRTGAAVIPAYIWGTKFTRGVFKGLFSRHHARVRFGPPVDLDDLRQRERNRATVHEASRRIMEAIYALAPEEDRERAERIMTAFYADEGDDTSGGASAARRAPESPSSPPSTQEAWP